MSELSTPSKPRRIKRLQIGMNVLIQILLVAVILITLNVVGFSYFKRWDLSLSSRFSISDKTEQVLKLLQKPLNIYVIIPEQGFPMYAELQGLLEEYEYEGRPHVNVEILDIYKDYARVTELATQFNFSDVESVVIVEYDGRSKLIEGDDLYKVDMSMAMFGEQPKISAFLGEQKLTSAILEVVENESPLVYYIQGHLEPPLESQPPLGLFHTFLERENIQTEALMLGNLDRIPEEASMVAIIAPQFDFTERDMELLQAYWQGGGRLLVMLDPSADTPRLNTFLSEHGVTPRNDRIIRPLAYDESTSLIVRDVPGIFLPGSPITDKLAGAAAGFIGGTESIAVPGEKENEGWEVTPLIQAAPDFWGEVDHELIQEIGLEYEEDRDHGEPLFIAASVQTAGVKDPRVQIGGARMVVVGNGKFLDENQIVEPNLIFATSAVNWLVDREALIGIPPREMQNFVLKISESQNFNLFMIIGLGIPLFALSIGVLVWWVRRH